MPGNTPPHTNHSCTVAPQTQHRQMRTHPKECHETSSLPPTAQHTRPSHSSATRSQSQKASHVPRSHSHRRHQHTQRHQSTHSQSQSRLRNFTAILEKQQYKFTVETQSLQNVLHPHANIRARVSSNRTTGPQSTAPLPSTKPQINSTHQIHILHRSHQPNSNHLHTHTSHTARQNAHHHSHHPQVAT